MGTITRSEATHRLKIIATKVNNAAAGCRDGNWKEGWEAAEEAYALLEGLLPHLEEAHEEAPTFTHASVGSMGYHGSAGCRASSNGGNAASNVVRPISMPSLPTISSLRPPEPISIPKPRPPLVTPPPVAAPRPIITPAPTPAPVFEGPEEAWFDPSRMSGPLYAEDCFRNHDTPALTDKEWEMTELFDKQTEDFRRQVIEEYQRTGKSVYRKFAKESK